MEQGVVLLGTTEREYTNARGQQRVARNVSLHVEGEGAGQLYVGSEDVFKEIQTMKPGARVVVQFGLRLFRGELSPSVIGIRTA